MAFGLLENKEHIALAGSRDLKTIGAGQTNIRFQKITPERVASQPIDFVRSRAVDSFLP
jgi:hypothetical protein